MSPHHPDASVRVTPGDKPKPAPRPSDGGILEDIHQVLEITDLYANGGQPSRLSNLTHSNITANTNRGAQNAVANQQAHSQLNISILGKASNKVQNLGPLEARASVDILTNNEIAQTLMDIKGALQAFSGGGGRRPFPPSRYPFLRKLLERLITQIKDIAARNQRVQGDGTRTKPFIIEEGYRLYVTAPCTLGFPGQSTINLDMLRQLLVGR